MPGATWANTSVSTGIAAQTGTDQVTPRTTAVLAVEQLDRQLGPADQAEPDRHEAALVAEHAHIAPVVAGALAHAGDARGRLRSTSDDRPPPPPRDEHDVERADRTAGRQLHEGVGLSRRPVTVELERVERR